MGSSDEVVLLRTDRFRVVRVGYPTPDGARQTREIVRHPGAVTILPLVDEQHLCLIRNYRASVGQTLIELPAGTLEPGEPPLDAARRELTEETGYTAGRWESLGSFLLSPGILDERMHLFVAGDLNAGEASREPGEIISNLVVSWNDARRMIRDGVIQDAKTIVGLLKFSQFK
jgi:ADP-ribose pyrophosphatase